MAKKKKKQPQKLDIAQNSESSEEENVNKEVAKENNANPEDESSKKSETETRGQMIQRHKRETKELKRNTDAILHALPKNDKSAKKESQEKVNQMEQELKQKQEIELNSKKEDHVSNKSEINPESSPRPDKEDVDSSEDEDVREITKQVGLLPQAQKQKVSKAKKRKAAKVAQEKERERRIEEEKSNTVSSREVEYNTLRQKLTPLNLKIKEIMPDGNCLYNAVADQLQILGKPVEKDYYAVLRQMAADYMIHHPDEFMPFIEDDDLTEEKFKQYCERTANTSAWGGQPELKALVHSLQTPIIVHTANENNPDIVMGLEYDDKPLHLSFHLHAYSLGEHYNSVVPLIASSRNEDSV